MGGARCVTPPLLSLTARGWAMSMSCLGTEGESEVAVRCSPRDRRNSPQCTTDWTAPNRTSAEVSAVAAEASEDAARVPTATLEET